MVIALRDAPAFQPALEAWVAHATANDPTLRIENKPYRKHPMYTFTHAGADAGGAAEESVPGGFSGGFGASISDAMRPTLVVLSDRILISTTRQYAQSEVRRIEAAKSEPHVLASAGAIPEGAFEVGWMDWGGLVGKLYDAGRALAPMIMQGSDFDASKLPPGTELFRHVKPSTSFSAKVDGRQYTYAASSLGPETPLALVGLAYAASTAGERKAAEIARSAHVLPGAEPVEGPITIGHVIRADGSIEKVDDETDAARETTLRALRDVKTGLAVYRSQLGRVPDALSELLKGTDAFPHGFLEGDALPKDGWDRALVYSATDKGAKYTLRSTGPNGIDEQGGGDDVSVP
jgi:hypothetical protein